MKVRWRKGFIVVIVIVVNGMKRRIYTVGQKVSLC